MRRSTTEQRARTNKTTTTTTKARATTLLFTVSAAARLHLDGEALRARFAATKMKVCENWVTGVVKMCGYYYYYFFVF